MVSISWILKSDSKDRFHCHNFFTVMSLFVGLSIVSFFSETAYAQFGGKSGSPSGSVVGADYNAADNSDSVPESLALEAAPFSPGSNSTSSALNVEGKRESTESNYMSAADENTLFNRRQRYFIKKLRLEFAASETIEREAGIAASWTRVGFYLRDLDNELITFEKSGKEANSAFITGMARDLNLVETTLDDHIDKILLPFEKHFPKRSSYVIAPLLPQSSVGLRAKMRALAEKSELVDFGTKALQAMGGRLAR